MAVARVPAPGCGEQGESTARALGAGPRACWHPEHPVTGRPLPCPTAVPHRNASGGTRERAGRFGKDAETDW